MSCRSSCWSKFGSESVITLDSRTADMQNHGKENTVRCFCHSGGEQEGAKGKGVGNDVERVSLQYTVFHFPAVPARVVSFHYATHMMGTPVDSVEYDRLIGKTWFRPVQPSP